MEQEKYLPELMAEKDTLDSSFVHAMRLLAEEIEKFQSSDEKKEDEEKKYLDVISNKNIKLSERVLIPVKQYPKFNFVGKLLGPRGNSLKRLQEETGAKMSILGKGSMRDKAKEEELRKSGEAKYAHLSDELHVLIEVFAPPGEAYSRMSHALEEIKKFLVPDYNDEIRQEQLRELSYLNGSEESARGRAIRGRGIRVPPAAPSRGPWECNSSSTTTWTRSSSTKRNACDAWSTPSPLCSQGSPTLEQDESQQSQVTGHPLRQHMNPTKNMDMMMDMGVNMTNQFMRTMIIAIPHKHRVCLNIMTMVMEQVKMLMTATHKKSGP
ncbi:KH domain-containing, RNA-binding, signal transduction-associated protein 2 isoform X2 [Lacerta agilis]|uniref:KH domain-containing, RNA-binding, signal transduction-associated protein 2 isoform X2 n=1 Tax=Lacerta agilis TaxID=80427 RepID=UPI00141A1C60|nr:KH domain-containing, RNA-binding, signal transduction-associated protein 2 isoform X2 [Lacerta agilis]